VPPEPESCNEEGHSLPDRRITIVVPVFNEQHALETLAEEIRSVAAGEGYDLQTVFVDDGSQDESWRKIAALAGRDPSIGGIRFRKNAGKAAALMAGFAAAPGDLIFTMDADLQDPPLEMPRFLRKIDEGYDVVSGWKRERHDPWHKVYPSRIFNRLIGMLTGVRLHDHVCGYKCFRSRAAKELRIYGELHRFMGVLSAARGFKVTEIATQHRARTTGAGKYGFTRFFKGFLDLITVMLLTRYRWRPQHLIGTIGLIVILATLIIPFFGGILFLLAPGLTLIAIGLIAEMFVAQRPLNDLYCIAEKVGWCTDAKVEQASDFSDSGMQPTSTHA
jgi:glycosyltransferase involved in cell wall biosynthesis